MESLTPRRSWDALKTPNIMTAPTPTQGTARVPPRRGARWVMVVVTDEVDQSHNNTAFYIDFFKQIGGQYNAGLVSFNAITKETTRTGCSANAASRPTRTRSTSTSSTRRRRPVLEPLLGGLGTDRRRRSRSARSKGGCSFCLCARRRSRPPSWR